MVEVEMKFPVKSSDEVVEKLGELGYKHFATRIEKDTYLNPPGRNLGETDEALRLRSSAGSWHLTYKGPKQGDVGKVRKEVECKMTEPNGRMLQQILELLGFHPVRMVNKERHYWGHIMPLDMPESIKDPITVTVDHVADLGTFVEIELISERADEDALNKVKALAAEMGLTREERRSYLELLLEGDKNAVL